MQLHFTTLRGNTAGYWISVALLLVMIAFGYGAAHQMEVQGHWISGMNNQVVWGLPHVFAVFLILAASGALNVASMASVFGVGDYKPWSRFSALLAICLLVGGLIVLVLDLGRPERLVVAMTYYNFKSIFAWNIFLYTGFVVVAVIYLYTMFERRFNVWTQRAGVFALVWRLVLTSGTGSIFGFLVARQFFDAAMMVPVFIVLSLMLGSAMFVLTSFATYRWQRIDGSRDSAADAHLAMLRRLSRLMGVFIALGLLLVAVFHLTNLYATEHHGVEKFILLSGGRYTLLFWIGQVLLGGIIPLGLIFLTRTAQRYSGLLLISMMVVVGGLCQLYVTIIGGQAYPLQMFPGKTVSSSFFDGVVANYVPRLPELLLGLGGVALGLLLCLIVARVLPFLPDASRSSHSA